jgi:hypothetical protein
MLDYAMKRQAVYIGSRSGEPAHIIRRSQTGRLAEWLKGAPARTGLADPKLEALRALSAAMTATTGHRKTELAAIVREAGLSHGELKLLLPTHDWQALLSAS